MASRNSYWTVIVKVGLGDLSFAGLFVAFDCWWTPAAVQAGAGDGERAEVSGCYTLLQLYSGTHVRTAITISPTDEWIFSLSLQFELCMFLGII